MRIYGFAYWADLHCVDCAEKFFDKTIDELADDSTILDPEGNTLYTLHSFDISSDDVCGDCFCNLLEQF